MTELKFRDVRQPERLKAVNLEADDLAILSRDQGAGVATDLDGNAWPTQLHVFWDVATDTTVVQPKGSKNSILPYKLSGIIGTVDVRKHFLAEFGPQPEPEEEEEPIASAAAEIVNTTPATEKETNE